MRPAALHRLDWRFLLPVPPPAGFARLVLLGGTAELASAARVLGVAREVVLELPAGREADAVVLLAGARADPAEAASRLVPGGALHWEIDRRSPRCWALGPGLAAKRLAAAGLSVVGTWAALPGFDPCRMYLPLGDSGVLAWHLASAQPGTTASRRLAGAVLQALAPIPQPVGWHLNQLLGRLGWHLVLYLVQHVGWHLAVTAVAAVAGPLAPERETPPVVAALAGLPPGLRRPGLQALVLKDAVKRAGTRVVVLPFPAGGGRPVAVLKVPKLPSLAGRTENEQAALAAVRTRLPPALARAVPRPLGLVRVDGLPVGVEEPLAGRPLRARRIEDLELAAGWLAAFHAETYVETERWGAESVARLVEAPLAELAREAPPTRAEARLFAAARARAAALAGTRPPLALPVVRQHRDFTVWNLLRTGDGLGVLDWEGCRPGLPLCDLFHLAASWHGSAQAADAVRRLFVEPERGGRPAAVARAVERYRSRLEIDARFVPLLLVLTWVELALRRSELRRALGADGADDAAGADGPRAALAVLATGADRLFGEVRG